MGNLILKIVVFYRTHIIVGTKLKILTAIYFYREKSNDFSEI